MVFAGSASRRLGAVIAGRLGVQLGASEVIRFSEGNLFVRVLDNVRGRDVFIVRGTAFPANDNFMELLFWIDALNRASAARVLVERGATDVYAAVSHALLTGPANERLDASPIRQLLTTDSVETQPAGLSAKVEVVSVGGLFAEAIRRIAARESVSVLFR